MEHSRPTEPLTLYSRSTTRTFPPALPLVVSCQPTSSAWVDIHSTMPALKPVSPPRRVPSDANPPCT